MAVLTTQLLKRERRHSTGRRWWPAAALVVVALVLCSAGTAGAAFLITGKRIKDETVTRRDIRDHSLTVKDIRGAVRGPAGPAGPVGQTGPAGPVGQTGPAGISAPERVSFRTVISAFTSTDVSVPCPTGKVVVGGGGASQADLGTIEQSAPTDLTGHGWTVSFDNHGGGPIQVEAVAVCVKAR
jgi:hypothetical protein